MCQTVWKNVGTSELGGKRSALLSEGSKCHTYHYSWSSRAVEGSMRRSSANTLERHPAFLSRLFLVPSAARAKQSAGIAAVPFNCQLSFELAGGTHPVGSAFS